MQCSLMFTVYIPFSSFLSRQSKGKCVNGHIRFSFKYLTQYSTARDPPRRRSCGWSLGSFVVATADEDKSREIREGVVSEERQDGR